MNERELRSRNQFGFTDATSTTNALKSETQRVCHAKEKGENFIIIALQIFNAFHSISA